MYNYYKIIINIYNSINIYNFTYFQNIIQVHYLQITERKKKNCDRFSLVKNGTMFISKKLFYNCFIVNSLLIFRIYMFNMLFKKQ